MYFCFSCSVCSAIAALVPSATATIQIGICFLMSMLKLIEMEFAGGRGAAGVAALVSSAGPAFGG